METKVFGDNNDLIKDKVQLKNFSLNSYRNVNPTNNSNTLVSMRQDQQTGLPLVGNTNTINYKANNFTNAEAAQRSNIANAYKNQYQNKLDLAKRLEATNKSSIAAAPEPTTMQQKLSQAGDQAKTYINQAGTTLRNVGGQAVNYANQATNTIRNVGGQAINQASQTLRNVGGQTVNHVADNLGTYGGVAAAGLGAYGLYKYLKGRKEKKLGLSNSQISS